MKIVYMNEQIRKAKPVIVVQDEDLLTEANVFEISVGGQIIGFVVFDAEGCEHVDTHDVKAWVEFNDNVELRSYGKSVCTPRRPKPKASAKKPNRKVKT
jgi:hypothetical protein